MYKQWWQLLKNKSDIIKLLLTCTIWFCWIKTITSIVLPSSGTTLSHYILGYIVYTYYMAERMFIIPFGCIGFIIFISPVLALMNGLFLLIMRDIKGVTNWMFTTLVIALCCLFLVCLALSGNFVLLAFALLLLLVILFIKESDTNTKNWSAIILQRRKLSLLLSVSLIMALSFGPVTNCLYYYFISNAGLYVGNLKSNRNMQNSELASMMNSVIGIPNYIHPYYRIDSLDITKPLEEEWMKFVSKKKIPRYVEQRMKYGDFSFNNYSVKDDSESLHEYANSFFLRINSVSPLDMVPFMSMIKPKKTIYNKLCGHFLTCELLTISVSDYVIEHSEILLNIIKIAEKPCDYIKDINEVKEEGEVLYSNPLTFMGNFKAKEVYTKDAIIAGIKEARKLLTCDKESFFDKISFANSLSLLPKKFVLIVITSSGIIGVGEERTDILVPRKDIE